MASDDACDTVDPLDALCDGVLFAAPILVSLLNEVDLPANVTSTWSVADLTQSCAAIKMLLRGRDSVCDVHVDALADAWHPFMVYQLLTLYCRHVILTCAARKPLARLFCCHSAQRWPKLSPTTLTLNRIGKPTSKSLGRYHLRLSEVPTTREGRFHATVAVENAPFRAGADSHVVF
jgi:hypothetical protein